MASKYLKTTLSFDKKPAKIPETKQEFDSLKTTEKLWLYANDPYLYHKYLGKTIFREPE